MILMLQFCSPQKSYNHWKTCKGFYYFIHLPIRMCFASVIHNVYSVDKVRSATSLLSIVYVEIERGITFGSSIESWACILRKLRAEPN